MSLAIVDNHTAVHLPSISIERIIHSSSLAHPWFPHVGWVAVHLQLGSSTRVLEASGLFVVCFVFLGLHSSGLRSLFLQAYFRKKKFYCVRVTAPSSPMIMGTTVAFRCQTFFRGEPLVFLCSHFPNICFACDGHMNHIGCSLLLFSNPNA